MKLKSLTIREAQSYEKKSGYIGQIIFAGPLGKVEIQVNDTLSQRILRECAAEIVAASREVAEHLTAHIIEQIAIEEEELIEPLPLDEVVEDKTPDDNTVEEKLVPSGEDEEEIPF
ncbi:hypothetical protein LCGC14_2216070 [marine sediment metagenome]|uniref:Uncharacterized protein n=1 Tax=marine sediment metagenome TaxID=412755 RepID=A0A0F9G822_9ZZZZ